MSLLDEARALAKSYTPKCVAGTFIAEADPTLRDEINEALRSYLPMSAIIEAMSRRGIEVSKSSLERHRRTVRGLPSGCVCKVEG